MTLAQRRKTINAVMFGGTALCLSAAVSVLFLILGYLVYHGGSAMNWDFLTKLPKPVGEAGGGMANAIVGSAKLLVLAGFLGIPIGMAGGVYLSEYGRHSSFGFLVRYFSDIINSVPSIVIGIFAYTICVLPVKRFSAVAGGVALGIMMIPIAVRSTEEFLRLVPQSIREASWALGLSRWRTIVSIVMPSAFRGLITGMLLDFSRVAGETAPLLFTAFNNRYWSHGVNEPTASLPVMIFTYAISPYEDWHRQAYAAGLLLLLLILLIGTVARLVLKKPAGGSL